MRAKIRLAARTAFAAVLFFGWALLVLAIVLFLAEQSGFLAARARAMLAQRLGPLGDELVVDTARLRWFEPAIELEGVHIGRDGEWLQLAAMSADLELSWKHGVRLENVELHGGRVRISQPFTDAVQGASTGLETTSRFSLGTTDVPSIRIEDIGIELETAHLGVLPLGRIDMLVRADDRGRPELWGRLVPSLAASAAESGKIFLHGKMQDDVTFEVRASATHLPIGTDYLPAGSDIEFVRAFEPHGVFELQAAALLSLDPTVPPRVRARARIHDGTVRLGSGGRQLDEVQFDLGSTWTPASWKEAFDPRAWRGEMKLAFTLEGSPVAGTAIIGPGAGPGLIAKAWAHSPRLALDDTLQSALGNRSDVSKMWSAFDPRGHAEVWIGARLPADFRPGQEWKQRLQIAGAVRLNGEAGLTYHGFARTTGARDLGFPLPIEKVVGEIAFAHDLQRKRPLRIALPGLSGDTGSSVITADGLVESHDVDAPHDAPARGPVEYDIRVGTRGVAVDEKLERALAGLSGTLPPAQTWKPFRPTGGKLDVDLRLARAVTMPGAAVELQLALHDVALSWSGLPVPITPPHATLAFRSNGLGMRALGFSLEGPLRTAKKLHFKARVQTDTAASPPVGPRPLDECALFDLSVERFSLTGDDAKIFVGTYPRIGAELDELAPKGFADVRYTRVRAARGGETSTSVEVTPKDPAQFLPRQFQMITSAVRGRVLVGTRVDAAGGETTETRLMPLVGTWGANVQVAFTARFPERTVTLYGAGIDPSSKSLLGSLRQAMSSPGSVPVDTAAAKLEGALDFIGEIQLGVGPQAKNTSNYRFFVHDSALTTADGFALENLRGEIRIANDQLIGDALRARLANTPVVLRDTRVMSNKQGFSLTTRFEAEGVPIDRDHLAAFVDPSTLDALIDELQWKGSLDVREGLIVVTVPSEGSGRLEFSGQVVPHDMSIQLGLPITVKRATAVFDKLVVEGGLVRAIVTIDGFDGLIAERALEDASMLVTYFEPKLSVENFTGRLEGGDLLPLGGDAERRGTVFSIGIGPPFGFSLALGMRNVQAGALLRGLFPSDMATRGRVDADLRLQGDMDHLLGIVGSGSLKVLESRLWSIPVFRALFGQLGLDDTAVFDSMAANLVVKDGRVEMNDITVRSPLLQLVGAGHLDFDGGLKYDLEVRYDLIDRLGPFTRLLYSIQNQLLSVAIRGDMARPEVILENPFTYLFRSTDRDQRPLPLPPFAKLPPRY